MKVKSEREVAHSCPTLRDPMDGSLPGSSIHGIFQARVLEWGAIASLNQSINFFTNLRHLWRGKKDGTPELEQVEGYAKDGTPGALTGGHPKALQSTC